MRTIQQRLIDLKSQGFDQSSAPGRDEYGRFTTAIRVKCSQCEALTINGVACHETSCRNMVRNHDDWED